MKSLSFIIFLLTLGLMSEAGKVQRCFPYPSIKSLTTNELEGIRLAMSFEDAVKIAAKFIDGAIAEAKKLFAFTNDPILTNAINEFLSDADIFEFPFGQEVDSIRRKRSISGKCKFYQERVEELELHLTSFQEAIAKLKSQKESFKLKFMSFEKLAGSKEGVENTIYNALANLYEILGQTFNPLVEGASKVEENQLKIALAAVEQELFNCI